MPYTYEHGEWTLLLLLLVLPLLNDVLFGSARALLDDEELVVEVAVEPEEEEVPV